MSASVARCAFSSPFMDGNGFKYCCRRRAYSFKRAAFFAESKFSRMTDASKVALVHLAARLKAGRYSLLDAQFPNPHLEQFGAVTVTEERFQFLLSEALARTGDFYCLGPSGAALDSGAADFAGADSGADGGLTARAEGAAAATGAGSSVLQVITQTS